MIEHFRQQLEYCNPITQDLLTELPSTFYDSGEEMKAGDYVLYGFRVDFEKKDDFVDLSLSLFKLCEREFPYYLELYTIDNNPLSQGYNIPIFIKKGEEEKYQLMKNNHLK